MKIAAREKADEEQLVLLAETTLQSCQNRLIKAAAATAAATQAVAAASAIAAGGHSGGDSNRDSKTSNICDPAESSKDGGTAMDGDRERGTEGETGEECGNKMEDDSGARDGRAGGGNGDGEEGDGGADLAGAEEVLKGE